MAEGPGFVLQNTMDEVTDGLFVGSAMAEADRAGLQARGITHVLSLAKHYAPSHPHDFVYKRVSIDDLPGENIIQYFPACNAFIDQALRGGGRVLVHCMAGQSRSATAAAAFMMWKQRLRAEQALAAIKAKRPQIYPNEGFREQLQLFYDIDYDVSPTKALYRRFLISHSAEHYREYGALEGVLPGADPGAAGPATGRAVRCKKCRRALVTDANILEHSAGAGQVEFSYKKRDTNGTVTPHAFPQQRACSSLFVEPMEWMEGVGEGLVENRILCPKCLAKLGAYNWAGAQCSCGKWITPSFQIHRAKVDEARQR
ncbi:tyrosine protein phosphatase yvh1 [Coemansia sp. RSA 552]|nr:tyrosine protein phosphatase yvh1 [Coemansia sp. RSA 552]